ncbi:hypothetical protein BGP_4459 [Beggiatoa sp. PS]|nr:hypothetical protein BGP_4459 [Beggiatoa sp. PS]
MRREKIFLEIKNQAFWKYCAYTRHGHKFNFSHEIGGQEKDFAHPTKTHPKKV